jgi:hypothetical protein
MFTREARVLPGTYRAFAGAMGTPHRQLFRRVCRAFERGGAVAMRAGPPKQKPSELSEIIMEINDLRKVPSAPIDRNRTAGGSEPSPPAADPEFPISKNIAPKRSHDLHYTTFVWDCK